ncbi:MAG: hypothetical protein M1822_004411 [Bathelium mastoideum]|nr:MAG: hypothetical protein M1822_004411 [Bathelium mastoideum]
MLKSTVNQSFLFTDWILVQSQAKTTGFTVEAIPSLMKEMEMQESLTNTSKIHMTADPHEFGKKRNKHDYWQGRFRKKQITYWYLPTPNHLLEQAHYAQVAHTHTLHSDHEKALARDP